MPPTHFSDRFSIFVASASFPIVALLAFSFCIAATSMGLPTVFSDALVWVPMTQDFFTNIGSNIGKHRPLFGFFAYLMHLSVQLVTESKDFLVGAVWRIQNFFFFCSIPLFAYWAIQKLTNNRKLAFFFAAFVPCSFQIYGWLHHALINLQGFFILYFSLWMFADYLTCPERVHQRRKLYLYALLFGTLMLGKAQYNILLALIAASLLIARSYLKDAALFFLIQLVPLICWYLFLHFALDARYEVYEVNRSDYSMVQYLKSHYLNLENWISIFGLFSSLTTVHIGLGTVMLAFLLYYLFNADRVPFGGFALIYFLCTSLFLQVVNFNIGRHAGDFAPIAYLSAAFFFLYLENKFSQYFWYFYFTFMACWTLINLSPRFFPNVI